jgi:hypothetical protein
MKKSKCSEEQAADTCAKWRPGGRRTMSVGSWAHYAPPATVVVAMSKDLDSALAS